jgi:hypothetical protein
MSREKQSDVAEKSKIMAWHFEKVPTKETTARLHQDLSTMHRIICLNMGLSIIATSPPPKKQAGRPRQYTYMQEDRRFTD